MPHFRAPRVALTAEPRPSTANSNEPAEVNWRRGLFRVWVLLSVAWILGWLVYLIVYGIQRGYEASELFSFPILLFAPPIALLLFGLAAGWAFRGFRTEKPGSPSANDNR